MNKSSSPRDPEKVKRTTFQKIQAEVLRLVASTPAGRFTTYGSIALHMNVAARHVAMVLSRLTAEEAERLPWHRVVSAEGRLSQNMEPEHSGIQRARLEAEGMTIDERGYIENSDAHFHSPGIRRTIRWSDQD
jgi:methylated-DNA-protein-cysteine methyltransferase related protein